MMGLCGGKNPKNPSGTGAAAACGTAPGNVIPKGCEYLNKPGTVEAPSSDFDNIRGKYAVGKGTAGKQTFKGDTKPSDSINYEVDVKGHKVTVIMPKGGAPKGKQLPTAEQIAKALATVPADQLGSIKQVVVNPKPNPDDAYWATQYNTPGFSSAASGGIDRVNFYPKSVSWDQAFIDSTMIHEGGHVYSGDLWKDPKKQKQWEDAIKKDKCPPSTYAQNSSKEDFSESLVMYSLSKGTKCEDAAKARYPERYKILDEMFKKK